MNKLPPADNEIAPRSRGYGYPSYVESVGYVKGRWGGSEYGGLLEYWSVLCRYKFSVITITFVGLAASVLLTLPQKPIYQARAALEIQNLNEDFLNIKQVTPVSEGGSA